MPALVPTDYYGKITWLGFMPVLSDRTITSEGVTEMPLDLNGFEKDAHYGRTRPSCSRVTLQHPKNTEIANVRQLSILSAEEMAAIAMKLDLEELDPLWLGATVVVSGIPDFTHIPPSSRLQAPNGTTLIVDMVNQPCNIVSMTIEQDKPGHGKKFRQAAQGRRGVTAWVEREGGLKIGDLLRLHVPQQRAWSPD
ncbi:MOSC domain-containing protein [Marivivens aquimaris]|uniref:MOSC domain-containing protein n=1 Tax=Marivivens aquimaris TaxID=2774876 RepID=UPI0018802522|nr:MOSC domain-containing protein [Marivivens aquimaris]